MARVDLETGFIEPPEAPEADQQQPGTPAISSAAPLESSGAARLRQVIEGALAGTLPLDEPLAPYEVQKFNAQHVSLVLDRCQGLDRDELEAKYGFNRQYLNIILRHPFALQIQQALLSQLADRCADPMERMKSYANEMLDVKMEIVRDKATPKSLRNAIADNILDRVGYGARQKVDVTKKDETAQKPSVPAGLLGRLVNALEAGQRVATVDYSRHTAAPARTEDSAVESSAPQIEPGNSSAGTDASLSGPPSGQEKVA